MFINQAFFLEQSNYGSLKTTLLYLTTAIGAVVLLISTVWFVRQLTKGFRLYGLSRVLGETDLIRRYGKWAIISGATDGIGKFMAIELARRGHSIIALGRNELKLKEIEVCLRNEKNVGEVVTVQIDLSDSKPINFDKIRGILDVDNRDIGILINNAGTMHKMGHQFNNVNLNTLIETLNTNIVAVVYLTRMIMPSMLARGRGLVLNVSSSCSMHAMPYINVYGPSKTFVEQFTQNLQFEYSADPIDIVCLKPGLLSTKMVATGRKQSKLLELAAFEEPDYFVKSAISALGTGYRSYSGSLKHALNNWGHTCTEFLGLGQYMLWMLLKLYVTVEKTPLMSRRFSTRSR